MLHFNNSFQCYLLQGSDLDRDDPDPDPTLEKTGQGSDRQENRIRIRNPQTRLDPDPTLQKQARSESTLGKQTGFEFDLKKLNLLKFWLSIEKSI